MKNVSGYKRGFTLIEIITVLIIMGVIATVSYPSVMKHYYTRQVSSASLELISSFTIARSLSIMKSENKRYGVVINSNGEYRTYAFTPDVKINRLNYDKAGIGAPYGEKGILSANVEIKKISDAGSAEKLNGGDNSNAGGTQETADGPVIVIFRDDGVPTEDGINFPMSGRAAGITIESRNIDYSETVKINKTTGHAGLK